MARYGRIGEGGGRTENNCCSTLAIIILFVAFILLLLPNGKVDLISDRNNTYVYIDGEKIPCEEYSEYRAYDYCNDEWKMPMG